MEIPGKTTGWTSSNFPLRNNILPQGCCIALPSCTGTGAFEYHILSRYKNSRWLHSFQHSDKTDEQKNPPGPDLTLGKDVTI